MNIELIVTVALAVIAGGYTIILRHIKSIVIEETEKIKNELSGGFVARAIYEKDMERINEHIKLTTEKIDRDLKTLADKMENKLNTIDTKLTVSVDFIKNWIMGGSEHVSNG